MEDAARGAATIPRRPAGPVHPERAAPRVFAPGSEAGWLFGRRTDLAVFGGSALASFLLLGWGWATGGLLGDTPPWFWVVGILGVDVAHVWSTAFRVYLDGDEVRRRPGLYLGGPAAVWVAGVAAHAISPATFWRLLAYAAVWHFVRQQVGWVTLYRRRQPGTTRLDAVLDTSVAYAATVWPLLYWHAHLPRPFDWFVPGDFVASVVPVWLPAATEPIYWGLLVGFLLRQGWRYRVGLPGSPGKMLVVGTTWACWWVGIVALDGDFAFTVTNVLIHGVPYLALTYRWGRARAVERPESAGARILGGGIAAFLGVVVVLALAEEALWDRLVWHDRESWFGVGPVPAPGWLDLLVPLLAVPQATHYLLDGFIWRGVARRVPPRSRRSDGMGNGLDEDLQHRGACSNRSVTSSPSPRS